MKRTVFILLLSLAACGFATDAQNVQPAHAIFNGKDLTGWAYASSPDYVGATQTPDGRYIVKDGVIVVPPAKGLTQLWTVKTYPNDFELRFEFRASPRANSGVFIRGWHQLQIRDYLTVGPYKDLKKFKPQDWNEIVMVVKGASAYCTCNGEVIETALDVSDENGSIGLEAETGHLEFWNLTLRELR